MELAQDVTDVSLYRIFADDELFSDLAVGHAVGDQAQHIQLAFGELGEEGLLVAVVAADVLQDARCDQRVQGCLLYTSPSPRDRQKSRMPSSA